MSILILDKLSKSFAGKPVLKEVQLRLDRGDKLALIGNNGSGKSTLLKLIAGKEIPDDQEARIHISSGTIISYLEQEFSQTTDTRGIPQHPEWERLREEFFLVEEKMRENPEDTALLQKYAQLSAQWEASGAKDYPYRLLQAAAGLGLDAKKLSQNRSTLSGGERMRLELASILISDSDLLLLDEPTNHLDIDAMEWLENQLKESKAAMIIVSHDRHFLDAVCNLTCEINYGECTVHRGNYSRFKEIQADNLLRLSNEQKKLEKSIEREKEIVQTLLSHRKISSYHSRQKKLGKLNDALKAVKSRGKIAEQRFSLRQLQASEPGRANRLLISAKDLSIHFPDSETGLFEPFSIEVRAGQKILFCGPNGCGKSSLLGALSGENPYMLGEIKLVENLRYAKLEQNHRFDHPHLSVIESLMLRDEHLSYGRAREILASYGFFGTDLEKELAVLSGGEKSRLALAMILQAKPDLLFLDEPTNHLDIASSEILEEALKKYSGTVLAVSHDRYFIENIADKVFGFIGSEIREFPHYAAYRNAVQAFLQEKEQAPLAVDKAEASTLDRALFSAEDISLFPGLKAVPPLTKSKQVQRQIRAKISQALRNMERELLSLDEKISDLEARFATESSAELYEEYGKAQIRQEGLLNLYIKAEEILEKQL